MAADDMRDLKATIASLHAKLDAVLQGTHDMNGTWHPGLAPVVSDHGKRLVVLEQTVVAHAGTGPILVDHARRIQEIEEAAEQSATARMTWKSALGLTLAGGVISQGFDWAKNHIKF